MPGPLLEKMKEFVDDDEDFADRFNNSPLVDNPTDVDFEEKIQEKLRSKGGGCCNAASVAHAVREQRRGGQRYE